MSQIMRQPAASANTLTSSGPSQTSTPSQNDLKRKQPAPPPQGVWSQPASTGSGANVMTQIQYALDYLKGKEQTVTFKDIWAYLSIPNATEDTENLVKLILRKHPKVEYQPHGLDGKGSYRFRPMHNVRSGDDLVAVLQNQSTAQGIRVSNLKEGWPGAIESIEALEKEHKILVTRNKKDALPKMVWADDPTLEHEVDNEFKTMWHQVLLPSGAGELRQELLAFGLTPTSQVKAPSKVAQDKKKRKVQRRGGKTTNTHMAAVLKDYSHLRR